MPKSSFPDREIIFHAVAKFFNFRVRERSARAPVIAASGSRKKLELVQILSTRLLDLPSGLMNVSKQKFRRQHQET